MITIFVGWVGIKQLTASIIVFQIFILMFMNSMGITYAATSLVGNSLGENKPNKARKYATATVAFGVFCTTILVVGFVLLRRQISSLFTSDEEVVFYFEQVVPLYAITMFFDLIQGVNGGMLRAMGYQKSATVIQFVALWIFMLPLAYFFGFVLGYGYQGIWMGVPSGSIIIMFSYLSIITFAPWKKLATSASKEGKVICDAEAISSIHKSMLSHH